MALSSDQLIAKALEAHFSGRDFSWLAGRWMIDPPHAAGFKIRLEARGPG